jgi:tRNA-specific 2-thiouridylase
MFGKKKKVGRVFVGLSGGVDSAVSAALLQQQGYDVTGVFIRIALPGYPCSAGVDKLDAMRVAAHLRIPFLEIDLSKEYESGVFKTSIAGFAQGQTPNPDVLCNREIKFGAFYNFARARGADFVATGHYAQTTPAKTLSQKSSAAPRLFAQEFLPSSVTLLAGTDSTKDQSYFLWMVPQKVLERVLFPVGNLEKTEVRKLAEKFGLPNAKRHDSQGLCFLGDLSMEDMLVQELVPTQGDVINENGEVVGRHEGAALYTLGQRHGFTLEAHSPQTLPHFVVAKDMQKNTVTVSINQYPIGVTKTEVTLREVNWIGELPEGPLEARFRYRQKLIPVVLNKKENICTLEAPVYAPVGQSLVLYRDARCLGGGIVESTKLC